VLLPEEHGLIFPDGYYLATGELKQFESDATSMVIERVVHAPNGEDVLYVFYNRLTGDYALMPYRLIAQKVEERISCNGFSLFPNGHLVLFRAEAEAQKHHMIQLRQTPFHQPGFEPAGQKDAFLYQVGNKEVVRCLAECNEVLTLVRKENPYAEIYTDLVKRCGAILDSYPWLSARMVLGGCRIAQVREAADKAVDEFDKVRRLQREAVERVTDVRKRCDDQFQNIRRASFRVLNDFVLNLAHCASCAANSSRSRKSATWTWRRSRSWRSRSPRRPTSFPLVREVPAQARGAGAVSQAGRRSSCRGGSRDEGRRQARKSRKPSPSRAANSKCSSRSSTA
jgi:hypothetical protein